VKTKCTKSMHLVASFSSCMLRLFIITVTAACFVLLWSVFALLYRKQQAMSTYQIYRWHCNAINLESCHIVCHTSFEEGSTAWCTSVLSLIHAVRICIQQYTLSLIFFYRNVESVPQYLESNFFMHFICFLYLLY